MISTVVSRVLAWFLENFAIIEKSWLIMPGSNIVSYKRYKDVTLQLAYTMDQHESYSAFSDIYFFLSGFSFTHTDGSQDSRGREGPSFILLYHFHLLTNIQTFICNFAREMTIK